MRYIKPFTIVCLSLLTYGAGCGSPDSSPVSLDKYQNAPEENQEVQVPPNKETANETAESTTTTMNNATTTPEDATPSTSSQPTTVESQIPPVVEVTPETLAFPGILSDKETLGKQIRVKTNKGEIIFELLPKEGPKAASNFVYLVKHKFYDGLIFHRVVPGFVIQGGDPLGTGIGGPGYKFEDDKVNLSYDAGIVAMANAGPNTNGSQFFIMLENNPLPPSYSIFGRVTQGMDVVRKIVQGDIMTSIIIETKK
ncbi:MAG: peptidylprolyl isomerase [Patescibacteria group bacterium]